MWWGVAAALVSNVLYSGGFVLEKRALATLPEVTVHRPARLLRLVLGSPLWIAGALSLAAGFGAQLAVYRTLPIAAAQGLFVSGLVLLVMLSARLLGEETTGRERYALGAILLALLMVVLSLKEGGAGADTVGRDAPYPLILLVCVPSLAAGVWLYRSAERRARRRHRMPTTGVEYGVAVGLLYGVSSLAIKGVSSHLTTSGIGERAGSACCAPPTVSAAVHRRARPARRRRRRSSAAWSCADRSGGTTATCLYTAVPGPRRSRGTARAPGAASPFVAPDARGARHRALVAGTRHHLGACCNGPRSAIRPSALRSANRRRPDDRVHHPGHRPGAQEQEQTGPDRFRFPPPRLPVVPADEVHPRVRQLRRPRYGSSRHCGQYPLGDVEFGRGRGPGRQPGVGGLALVAGRAGGEHRALAADVRQVPAEELQRPLTGGADAARRGPHLRPPDRTGRSRAPYGARCAPSPYERPIGRQADHHHGKRNSPLDLPLR
ncbi:hypothetical protein SHIRM173S_07397 [Streptomyces hirsutus]